MKNAAREGDPTEHGGVVSVGCPRVTIEGRPASRLGDLHQCPQFDGPKPHVGGPIAAGSTRVSIGGHPAARVGDQATCSGPPDRIAAGAIRVFIG